MEKQTHILSIYIKKLINLQYLGTNVLKVLHFAGGTTMLVQKIILELFRERFYFREVLEQLHHLGYRSLGLVAVTGLMTGSVMALQFGYGLSRFGGSLYVPKIVALAILREMGPVFTSLLLAARLSAGMAAELASMKVTQQIDAIYALGTNPISVLVIPRLLATLIAVPLLTLFSDFIAFLGAMVVAQTELHIQPLLFLSKALESLRPVDLTTGLMKSFVFAFFISIIACWKGLHTSRGTQGVGKTTTEVVVLSSIFIMVSDFFLSKFFLITLYPKY